MTRPRLEDGDRPPSPLLLGVQPAATAAAGRAATAPSPRAASAGAGAGSPGGVNASWNDARGMPMRALRRPFRNFV